MTTWQSGRLRWCSMARRGTQGGIVVFVLLMGSACSGERVEAPKSAAEVMDAASQRVRPVDGVRWPDAPADGAPVVAEFLALVDDDGDARAQLRMFNFAEKDVELVEMELKYLGSDGAEIKRFPWKSKVNISAQSHGKYVVGAFLPVETHRVDARIHAAVFVDGSRWNTPKTNENSVEKR